MRTRVLALLFSLAFTTAASAQMCGGSMQPAQTAQAGGMSCMGGHAQETQATDTFGRPAAKSAGMMCACCRNMAMMGTPKQGEDHKGHQGMEPEKKE